MRARATRILSALILVTGSLAALPALADQTTKDASGPRVPQHTTWTQSGEATWYGPRHEGQRTTSGERFDSHKLTAAHSTLPMGSWVRVTVENTGRTVVVRVNDREPPHGVRCIDLSREAASRLGIVARGVAAVSLAQITSDEAATEVAEAPDDAEPVEAGVVHYHHVTARHGRRHTHRAHR